MTSDREHWSKVAAQWIAWARAPNHDPFWSYRAQLLDFIGRGTGEALDVGCGEGRISRALKECGRRVTATDAVPEMLFAAEQSGSADAYRLAEAAKLPFDDGSFDLVMAYNVLMDVDNVHSATKEFARVLRPTGTLVVSIVHPFADRGRFNSREPSAPFIVEKSYFGRERFEAIEEQEGLSMHFAGWSQPLEYYIGALADAELAVTELREPLPDIALVSTKWQQWTRIPLFLWLKATPLSR